MRRWIICIIAILVIFGLERDPQQWLRRNIADLEPGLSITDDGRERKVTPGGFIDISGRDGNGAAVVIELKAGTADRDALGQILAYMGDLMATEKPGPWYLDSSRFYTARHRSGAGRSEC